MKKLFIIGAAILIAAAMATPAMAATVELKFAWEKNTEAALAGYRLYYGPTSGSGYTAIKAIPVAGPNHPDTTLQSFTGEEGQTSPGFPTK